jgi:hypothetical protein
MEWSIYTIKPLHYEEELAIEIRYDVARAARHLS